MMTPVKIVYSPPSVALVAEVDESRQAHVRLGDVRLSDHDNCLHIIVDTANSSVKIEIQDFDFDNQHWQVTASSSNSTWVRTTSGCASTWNVTMGEVRVDLTARSESSTAEPTFQPTFIAVEPDGTKPDI